MKHSRPDYNRIQDPENKIPEDEPVFLLRAQDKAAPSTLRHWATLAKYYGAKRDITDAALQQAIEMELWQENNKNKIPDL